jgi:catalase
MVMQGGCLLYLLNISTLPYRAITLIFSYSVLIPFQNPTLQPVYVNFFIMASMKTSGDLFRNYQDDRNAQSQETVYTTSNGVPMPHSYETQRVSENGPLLPQDFHLIDLLSHFDRERIPERVVHAKGSGVHGVYKTTHTLNDICLVDMFQKGKECPITVLFSTMGGESGSHDCAHDPRGFFVKFRTD